MKKVVRSRLLLIFLLMVGLIMISPPFIYANEEEAETELDYAPEDKAAAVKVANDAILLIPSLDYFVTVEQQDIIAGIINARALVDMAKEEFGAVDSDFQNLGKLIEAESMAYKLLAIKAARDAVDAIPKDTEITDDYREAVEEARRLVDFAMKEYGATYFDICWRYDALKEAEKRLDEEPEPEPEPKPKKPDDRLPTPPTGGFSVALAVGLIFSGAGMLLIKKRYKG